MDKYAAPVCPKCKSKEVDYEAGGDRLICSKCGTIIET